METKPEPNKSKGEFTRKLSRYSAVTVVGGMAGTIAGFESTEAALVRTTSGQTLVNNPVGVPTAVINLDGDAADDVAVTIFSASILSAQGLGANGLAGPAAGSGFFYPTAFAVSNQIHGGLLFSGGVGDGLNTFGTLANSSGVDMGNWLNAPGAVTGYLGVEFAIGGDTHYGWVHITWDHALETATIHEYAYEDVAGASAHVPEPSVLALLGMGVAGLAVRRRRKSGE